MSRPASRSSSKNPSGASTIRWPCSGRVVTGRRLCTITVPSAIGGTKCPSMMSTWNTPTYGSTAATCAPNRAKSAARMEAATVPMWPSSYRATPRIPSAGGPTTRGERRDEHGVAPVPMRPEPVTGRPRPSGPSVSIGSRSGRRAQQRVTDRIRLGPRERAHRVHQPSPGTHGVRRGRTIASWSAARRAQPLLRHAPQELGAAPGRAHAAARRVHEHPIERPAATAGAAASCTRSHGCEPEPVPARRRSDRRGSRSDPPRAPGPRARPARRRATPCRRERHRRRTTRSPRCGSSTRTTKAEA